MTEISSDLASDLAASQTEDPSEQEFGPSGIALSTYRFPTGWFIVGLLTQTLIVHMIRTPKLPFVESRPAWPLLGATLLVMAIGVFLPMGPLAAYFKLQALPWPYFVWLAGILAGYVALTSLMKRYYVRRYGWN